MNDSIGSAPFAFSIQTMETTMGGSLRSIEPDAEGVYKGVPIAIIGKPSRNNVFYDPASFVSSMTNPQTRFNKSLIGGGLEGEWGHPNNAGLDIKGAIARTMHIDSHLVSHYFRKVYSKKSADGQYYVVYGDVVPCGPCGQYLIETFADPKRNTAFSLRSLTSKPEQTTQGFLRKKVIALITFDAVSTPGFEEASKRFMDLGNEEFKVALEEEGLLPTSAAMLGEAPECSQVIGCENISSQALLDLLETDNVTVTHKERQLTAGDLINSELTTSAFHSLYQGG